MPARAHHDKEYYRTLGLHPEATEEEIRKAYRRLALQWHPDRNPGDRQAEERFKEISEAYAVLIDPAKRRAYDRARLAGTPADFGHTREDIFRDLFADPRASAVFEELAREFERMGMRMDRHVFHRTLFGGRGVVTGGVFIITPFTPVLALLRVARAALRGAQAARPVGSPGEAAPLRSRGLFGRLALAGRWLMGLPPGGAGAADTVVVSEAGAGVAASSDVTRPLRLTRAEAARGGPKRLTLRRGGELDEILVTIPPDVRPGTKLRLRGKGRAARGARPGDLYLAVEITDE